MIPDFRRAKRLFPHVSVAFLVGANAFAEIPWTVRNPGIGLVPFESVVGLDRRYLAFGDGIEAVSTDGLSWKSVPAPTNGFALAASSDSVVVVVGKDRAIHSSRDGRNWTAFQPPATWAGFGDIAWTGSRFVASGILHGLDSLATSVDGLAWRLVPRSSSADPSGEEHFAVSGQGVVLGGRNGLVHSLDGGRTWRPTSTGRGSRRVVWTGREFLSLGLDGRVQASEGGSAWRDRAGPGDSSAPEPWRDLGKIGDSVYLIGRTAYLSGDGSHWRKAPEFLPWWTLQKASHPQSERTIASFPGLDFILGPTASIWARSRGDAWRRTTPTVASHHLRSVATGGGVWVAVGDSGTILRSSDGMDWTAIPPSTTRHLRKVLWTGKTFQILGDSGTLMGSVDGRKWATTVIEPRWNLYDGVWTDTLMVLIGDSCMVFRSTDGKSWKSKRIGGNDGLRKIAYSGSRFVIGAVYNIAYGSGDGWNWEDDEGAASFGTTLGIAWTGSNFVIGSEGVLEFSKDGIGWGRKSKRFPDKSFSRILDLGGRTVVAATDGSVFELVGETDLKQIGSPLGTGMFDLAGSKDLWVQVGSDGAIVSAPAPDLVPEVKRVPSKESILGKPEVARP